jgi:hypothetical protein
MQLALLAVAFLLYCALAVAVDLAWMRKRNHASAR